MSIANKLTKLETDISNAYNSIELKSGTIPQNKNTENLASAIESIVGGEETILNIEKEDVIVEDTTLVFDKKLYTELSYIQSTGSQYIDTEYKPKGNSKYEFKFSNISNGYGILFGSYNSDWNNGVGVYCYVGMNMNSTYHYYQNITTNYRCPSSIEGVFDKGTLTINNTTVGSVAEKSFVLNRNMYLFGGNYGGSLSQAVSYCLEYFKIYEDDELIRDFIPVKDENGTVCLYEKVTETYFYNKGTGSFIAGEVKGGN